MAENVLLTGISGFIAKHVALTLLDGGHTVRGTVRSPAREEEVRAALRRHLKDPKSLDRLSFAVADLTADVGWEDAMRGMTVVVHTASPFPLKQPKDPQELIGPAVDGTLRVLRAAKAAGVTRIVVTSSTAAVVMKPFDPARPVSDESDWSDPDYAGSTAYSNSKTLAERAAWEYAEAEGLALTTVNPGLVCGPPLDEHFGSSIDVVKRLLKGKDPVLPQIGFGIVDVRDVAAVHAGAVAQPETAGRRLLTVTESVWIADIARTLKGAYPGRRITTRVAPDCLIRIGALVIGEAKAIVARLGEIDRVDNSGAREVLGREFLTPEEAVLASAAFLVENDLV